MTHVRVFLVWLLAAFVSLSLSAQAAGGYRTDVGAQGTSIALDGSWHRGTSVKDVGRDQFERVGLAQYFYLIESPGVVPSARTARAAIDTVLDRMNNASRGAIRSKLPGWSDADTVVERSRLDARLGGIDLSYLLIAVSGYGSTYLFLGWTTKRGFSAFETEINSIARSLDAKTTNAKYRDWLAIHSEYAWLDDAELRLDYPSRIFTPASSDDHLIELDAVQGSTKVFLEEGDSRLESAKAARSSLHVDPFGSIPYSYQNSKDGESGTLTLHLPSRFAGKNLDLRLSGGDGEESLQDLARRLLSGLVAKKGQSLLPYPRVPKKSSETTSTGGMPAGTLSRFLAASSLAGVATGEFRQGGNDANGLWFATTLGLWRIGKGALAAEHQDAKEDWQARYIEITDRFYRVADSGGALEKVEPEDPDPPAVAATKGKLAVLGYRADLGLVYVEESVRDGALASIWKPGIPVWRLRFGDANVLLGQAASPPIGSVGPKGILVAWMKDRGSSRYSLRLVADGATQGKELGVWAKVSELMATGDGWLVEGKPEGDRAGIWRLASDSSRKLLVGGDGLSALALSDGKLWYASRFENETGSEGAWGKIWIRSIDMPELSALGPKLGVLDGDALNRFGATLRGMPLAKREDIDAAWKILDAKVTAAFGVGLPTSSEEVDRLIAYGNAEGGLEEPGFSALLVILAHSLLSQGALWVDAEAIDDQGYGLAGATRWESSDLASQGYFLPGLLASALYDEEGYYDPAQSFAPRDDDGRKILIGTSVKALVKKTKGLAIGDFDARIEGDPKTIAAWLLLPQNARNLHLRSEAYDALVASGGIAKLDSLLPLMAASPSPLESYYSLLEKLDMPGAAAMPKEERQSRLREAISLRPQEGLLYYLMGKLWEEGTDIGEDDSARALACYRKAQQLGRYGDLGPLIEAEIKRLQEKLLPPLEQEPEAGA